MSSFCALVIIICQELKVITSVHDYIKESGFMTSKQLGEITKITTTAGTSLVLKRLIDKGLLKTKSKGRSRYYELI
jgi:ATP-dependent DNA helicase RecG